MEVCGSVNRLVKKIDDRIDEINSGTGYMADRWSCAWEEIVASACVLGHGDKVTSLGGPLPALVCVDDKSASNLGLELHRRLCALRESLTARTADSKTDDKKRLPPHGVNDCARYIMAQRKLISEGKRPTATKKALIAEHLGCEDTGAMERELQPSRYGWLLNIGAQTDK